MRRRTVLCSGGNWLGILLSGCVGDSSEPPPETPSHTATQTAPGTPTPSVDSPAYDCEAATRPPPPDSNADPPGEAERYTYPSRPDSLSSETLLAYVERYERAYRLNKLRSQHSTYLLRASVSVAGTDTYEAPEGAAIVQVKYTYDAEIEGYDGPIEIDSPLIYASYYVGDDVGLRAVNTKLQEDVSRLVVNPMEQGQPVECF